MINTLVDKTKRFRRITQTCQQNGFCYKIIKPILRLLFLFLVFLSFYYLFFHAKMKLIFIFLFSLFHSMIFLNVRLQYNLFQEDSSSVYNMTCLLCIYNDPYMNILFVSILNLQCIVVMCVHCFFYLFLFFICVFIHFLDVRLISKAGQVKEDISAEFINISFKCFSTYIFLSPSSSCNILLFIDKLTVGFLKYYPIICTQRSDQYYFTMLIFSIVVLKLNFFLR